MAAQRTNRYAGGCLAVCPEMQCAICLKEGHSTAECPKVPSDFGKREFTASQQQEGQKRIHEVEESFVDKVLSVVGKIPFALDAAAMYYCLRDPKTPFWVKASIATSLAYFISPVDAIPDIIPVIGYADDATVVYTCMAIVHAHITSEHIGLAKKLLNQRD
jgi:uncharacterized membrane protein YkvA (DUF1232 family)